MYSVMAMKNLKYCAFMMDGNTILAQTLDKLALCAVFLKVGLKVEFP